MNEPRISTHRDHGIHPLDAILQRWRLTNAQLVAAAGEQLTHKQVQHARKGRQLTLRMMMKLTRLLNEAIVEDLPATQRERFTPYLHRDLFTYAKGHDPTRPDPNACLIEST